MDPDRPTFFERLSSLLLREPEDREQLIQLLHSAHERELLDADALSITEGALAASEIPVRDIMVPRARMEVLDIEDPLERIIDQINHTGHSRFPVIEENRDNVIGILLAKDLLRVRNENTFNLRDCLRPVVFIPESKRLNVLLREFRVSRNHMAIVIDEYGGVAGLVTIEDVLEQIVGDIDDEHDDAEDASQLIAAQDDGQFVVDALTPIADFNQRFGADFDDDEYDTIGGLVTDAIGHLPEAGEELALGRFRFTVARADARRLLALHVAVHADH